MLNDITIYVMFTPIKTISHAYVNEKDAKEEMLKIFINSGEKFSLEPCALKIDEEFVKRMKLLLSHYT